LIERRNKEKIIKELENLIIGKKDANQIYNIWI